MLDNVLVEREKFITLVMLHDALLYRNIVRNKKSRVIKSRVLAGTTNDSSTYGRGRNISNITRCHSGFETESFDNGTRSRHADENRRFPDELFAGKRPATTVRQRFA